MPTPPDSASAKSWLWRLFSPVLLLGLVLGVALTVGASAGWRFTSSTEFCLSCHEMAAFSLPSFEASRHGANPSGIKAGCPDCHLPQAFWPRLKRKVAAASEIYHHWKGAVATQALYAAKRDELDERVWAYLKANDSGPCRNCHQLSAMTRHLQRFPRPDDTCITCHKGVGHRYD